MASYLRTTLGFQALEAFKDSFTLVWILSVSYTALLNPRHKEEHKEASWKQVKTITSSTGALLSSGCGAESSTLCRVLTRGDSFLVLLQLLQGLLQPSNLQMMHAGEDLSPATQCWTHKILRGYNAHCYVMHFWVSVGIHTPTPSLGSC